jgi:hypothetical protein
VVALALSRNAIILERGRIVHAAPSRELARDIDTLDRLLGLGEKDEATAASSHPSQVTLLR